MANPNRSLYTPTVRQADVRDVEKHLGYIDRAHLSKRVNMGTDYFYSMRADITRRFYAPEIVSRLLDARDQTAERIKRLDE